MASSEIKMTTVKVNQAVAVIGAGVAAMQSAVSLSKLGHKVTIVTAEDVLGGRAAKFPQMFGYVDSDSAIKENFNDLNEQIKNSKNIEVLKSSVLESVAGEFGNFVVSVKSNGKENKIAAGAIILDRSDDYGDLDKLASMIKSGNVPGRVAIVLDVAKQQTRAVWGAVLSAAKILTGQFGSEVVIYCQSSRVAAEGLEELYRKVRQAGVVIIKFDSKPTITEEPSGVTIEVYDEIIGAKTSSRFDLLVTADSDPQTDAENTAEAISQLRTGPGSELQYDDVWLAATKTNLKGVFAIGAARGNSDYKAAFADSLAAAGEIGNLLSKDEIEIAEDAAIVDAEKCVLCLTCRRICPHGAISIDSENESAKVSLVSCMRCGACAAECPASAIQLPRYSDDETRAKLAEKPSATIFVCENSAVPAAETAKARGFKHDGEINFINVPCAGKVDPKDILAALEKGSEKVLIVACHPESCQYLTGSSRAQNRVKRINDMLTKAGIDSERVIFKGIAAIEPMKFMEFINMVS